MNRMDSICIDYRCPIRQTFLGERVLVCLSPFHREVFADHFDWEGHIEQALPLIENISWEVVAKQSGIGKIDALALGLLNLSESLAVEMNDFCESEKIVPPDYRSDEIPMILMFGLLNFFRTKGYQKVESFKLNRFPLTSNQTFGLNEMSVPDLCRLLKNQKFLRFTDDFAVVLPDYDCPYTLIMGSSNLCDLVCHSLNLETMEVTDTMSFDWWNDRC